jgi:hypothetical protein
MRLGLLAIIFMLAILPAQLSKAQTPINWPAHYWQPPLKVPEIAGATTYTCQTSPYQPTFAVIRCNPMSLGQFPPYALVFLRVHEYGHVNQLATNPGMYYSAYAEYDADCYAAANLANSDPLVLQQTINFFYYVVGQGMKDATHGSGIEMAQRALQCARSVVPNFMAAQVLTPSLSPVPSWGGRGEGEFSIGESEPQDGPAKEYKPIPQQALVPTDRSDDLDKITDTKGAPEFCTALDLMIDSSHSKFWEASTRSGAIRPTIGTALDAECIVSAPGRNNAICKFHESTISEQANQKLRACLSTAEWTTICPNCAVVKYQHPGHPEGHPVVTFDTKQNRLEFSSGEDAHTTSPAKKH